MYDTDRGATPQDARLVEAAQNGDQVALDALVGRYLPLLYNIVGRALDGNQDVDDVVQETLFRVVDRLRDLRDPAAFRSWLVAIAMRQVRERWRSRQAGPLGPGPDAAQLDTADPGADFVDLTILRLALTDQRRETALATRWLEEDDRELLALWWLEAAGELTRAELVAALGLSAGHASVRVQRMKAQLETARTVVRAIQAAPRCPELDVLAHRWDGRPTSAWRKVFARHIRDCVTCAVHREGLVDAERLLVGLGLVPVPILLGVGLTRAGLLQASTKPAAATRAAGRGAAHSRRAVKSGRATRRLALHGSAKAVAASVVVVAVAAGTVYAATRPAPAAPAATATVAASSPTPAPKASATGPVLSAAPARTSAKPSQTAVADSLAGDIATSALSLGASTTYLQSGYNEEPGWRRIDTAAAPNGTVYVAWQASGSIHVTPLTASGARAGSDIVVSGAQEISGLVGLSDGFALLTRMADTQSNIWNETAAWLVRYHANGSREWAAKLTGTSSDDTAPVLDGALRWNGSEFGAYFVVHGAGGFASGHYGDKLVYVGASGSIRSGGWSWGCSHNEGIALWPMASGTFASACYDDWRSGFFVTTGIGAPDVAPVIERSQCWAGYCGGIPGGLTRTSGGFATLFSSTGMASQELNPADSSGRGWTVTPRWHTHQVAIAYLNSGATSTLGKPVYLTSDTSVDNINPHIAPYGPRDFLVSWESVANASCNAGTCLGTFTGTHIRVVDGSGRFVTPDLVVQAHIAGDIAILPDGSLMWAAPTAMPSYSAALGSSGPSTRQLTIAHLKLSSMTS